MVTDDITNTATSTLLGGAIMGGEMDVESAAAQLAGTMARQAISSPVTIEIKSFEPQGKTSMTQVFATSHQPDLSDYHQAVAFGQGRYCIQGLPDYAWNPQLDVTTWKGADYSLDVTSDTSRSLGTSSDKSLSPTPAEATVTPARTSPPAPSITPPVSKIAVSNNYVSIVPPLTVLETGGYTFAQLLDNYATTVKQTPSLLSIGSELLRSLNPITPIKEAFYGVDSSGKFLSVGTRVIDSVMAGVTLIPITAGAGLVAKAGFFAGREVLAIGASTSLKTLGRESAGLFRAGTEGVEAASNELLNAIKNKGRTIVIAKPGTEEYRYLEYINAEANVGGPYMTHILLKENPRKPAVLEEFLHGTQQKLGIIDCLGPQVAEVHVKEFMIRHQQLLGLSREDIDILKILRDRDINIYNQLNRR